MVGGDGEMGHAPGMRMRYLEVGQGVSAGAPDSQTMTSVHRQTRAASPALSRHKRVISYIYYY